MKKLKLFFACLLMAVLSIGQVWAADPVASQAPANGKSYVVAAYVSSKYYALPNTTSNGSTLTGVEVTLDSDGKVSAEDAEGKTWTLTEGSTSGQFLFSYTSGTNTYYLYKNGTGKTNYNFKVSTGNQNYWTFTANGTGYTVAAYDRGTNNVNIQCDNGTFKCYSTASAIILLPIASDDPEPACSSEITITKADNPANGTFTIDNSGDVCIDEGNATVNVTAMPNTGYHLATVVSAEGTIGDIEGNTCQITNIGASTTISVTFAENPKYKVSFNVGGSTGSQADITEASAGAGITLPDGPIPTCSADGWEFAGWKETSGVAEQTTTAPTLLAAGANFKPAADCTLYAVYKKDGGSGGSATVTITPSEFTGDGDPYTLSHDQAAFTIQVNKNSGTKPTVNATAGDARVYAGSTMVISNASPMTELVFNISTQGKKRLAPITASVGSIAAQASGDETVTWTGNATEVTFTVGATADYGSDGSSKAGQLDFDNISATAGSATTYYLSAPTCAAPTCENLGKPSVTVTNKTYNSARLTWESVANADKYLVKFNGVDQDATGNTYFDATNLDAATTYTYQVKALAEEGQDDWCDGEFTTEANFTTESAPAATLTLSEIGETHNFAGDHTVGETVTLPLSATECSKTFVGWDPASNWTSAPTYAPGASYTLTATTQTLYAVYANPVGAATYVKTALASIPSGSEVVVTELYDETIYAAANDGGTSAGPAAVEVTETTNVLNVGSNTNIFWVLTKDGDNFSLTVKGGTDKLYCTNTNNGVRVGTNENNVFSIKNNYLYNNATSRYVGYNHGDGGLFRCYTTINTNINEETLAFYKKNVSYEDYSTACAAPLASPTFSVNPADGPFDTEISVELDATEGTIYYTLNGTDPTNESTEYTDPIVLNTCGNKTIKAIAISSTNHSAVASATYEMTIPVPTNSQVAPYSPTKAREVIASGCYDGTTIMYVKGVVKSCSAWNSTYGNYDVVVRNIGEEESETFTYYHMYKASGNTKFTSDENIEVGDTILAAGVLTLFGSTYEFANNTCYMVEHKKITSKTSIDSDIDNPITVADALGYIDQAATYDLSEDEFVAGIVESIAECSQHEGTYDIIVLDATDNTKQIKFFGCDVKTFAGIKQYDQITGKGKLFKYFSTYELNYPCEVVALTPYVAPVVDVTGVEVDETAITLKEGSNTTLVATVNPTEATNKTVTWESSNPAVATVDNGVVTAVAIGTTTITATTEEGGFTATCAVTVIDASARDLPNAAFKKVTATDQITDGKYLIVYAAAGVDTVAFDGALTTLDAVGNTIDVTIDGDYIVAPGDAAFTIDVTNHTLKSYSGKYIGRTANSNGMNQADDAALTNTFAIDGDGNAVITSSGNPTLRYNYASDQLRFRYYKSGQQAIQLYKMVEPEEIRGNLNDGKWGTICPAKKVLAPVGASFYKLNYMELNPDGSPYKFFFDEIGENASLEAGKPYLFIAEGTTITGVKVGDAADDGLHVHNGFVGYIGTSNYDLSSDNDVYTEDANNYYGLQNNIFKLIYGTSSYMINERAFIQITPSSKPATTEQPAPAYSRRRLVVGAGAPQTTQGFENLQSGETPMKVMIEGQMYILRGERVYDATGRLVK